MPLVWILLAVVALILLGGLVIGLTLKLLWLLLAGLVVGALARLLLPGRQALGLLATALFGIGGSLLGGILGKAFGIGGFLQLMLAVVLAALLIELFDVAERRASP